MIFFALIESWKLISRKIWVVEKLWNFHTVFGNFQFFKKGGKILDSPSLFHVKSEVVSNGWREAAWPRRIPCGRGSRQTTWKNENEWVMAAFSLIQLCLYLYDDVNDDGDEKEVAATNPLKNASLEANLQSGWSKFESIGWLLANFL